MHGRLLIGLSVGSGGETADAVALRVDGVGFDIAPHVVGAARVPLAPAVRAAARRLGRVAEAWPARFAADLTDSLAAAAHRAALAADTDVRAALAIGLLTHLPETAPGPNGPCATLADRLAELTGVTVASGFAADGTGYLLTQPADYFLFSAAAEDRVLIHLGSACSVVGLPAGGTLSDVVGLATGPGLRLLDDMTALGTRGREAFDPGGTKAVQGRCLDDLLGRWLALPSAQAAGPAFLAGAFDAARLAGGTLHDLLCTATHFIARCLGAACDQVLPAGRRPQRVLASGGGVRNGFLWKLLGEQFPDCDVERSDAVGVPASARYAAEAAVLAGLTLDGAPGEGPVGRIAPGDPRNWAACSAWVAEHAVGSAALRVA